MNHIDVRIRRVLAIVALLFIAAVTLQIHGSSIAVWKTVLNDTSSPSSILFSTPKTVRTDEWLAWTPAVVAQALHDPPFPVVIGLYFLAPLEIFCGTFLACLVLNNGLVNPIATGPGPLLQSDVGAVVREIKRRAPAAKWVIYSTTRPAQFLKAQGAEVINGLNYVPNLTFWREFDPAGKFDGVYNHYAFSAFALGSGSREFRLTPPVAYGADVLPTDLSCQCTEFGMRRFRIRSRIRPRKGLRLISNPSGAWLWIYQIAAAQ